MSESTPPYVMSGAIRPHGKKEKPLASTRSLRQQEDVIRYFTERRQAIARGTKRTFSIDKPHTCVECQNISIDAAAFTIPEKIHVLPDLRSVINAAIAGCAFYEWLADLLILESDGSPDKTPFLGASSADVSFRIALNTARKSDWYMLFMVDAELIEADGEYEAHALTNKGSLHAWTTEGNLAAFYVRQRPIELDKGSQRTMRFVHDSLQVCKASHKQCRYQEDETRNSVERETIAVHDLPTRLL